MAESKEFTGAAEVAERVKPTDRQLKKFILSRLNHRSTRQGDINFLMKAYYVLESATEFLDDFQRDELLKMYYFHQDRNKVYNKRAKAKLKLKLEQKRQEELLLQQNVEDHINGHGRES